MELRTGNFETSLDDKGRISIPSRVREWYPSELVLSRGMQPCVWVVDSGGWEHFKSKLEGSQGLTQEQFQALQYQHVSSAQRGEIDKSGRIAIPPALRRYAKLGHDCLVLSFEDHLEIWDAEVYEEFLESSRALYLEAVRKLGPGSLFKPDGK